MGLTRLAGLLYFAGTLLASIGAGFVDWRVGLIVEGVALAAVAVWALREESE